MIQERSDHMLFDYIFNQMLLEIVDFKITLTDRLILLHLQTRFYDSNLKNLFGIWRFHLVLVRSIVSKVESRSDGKREMLILKKNSVI